MSSGPFLGWLFLASVPGAIIVWQLATGKLLSRSWGIWTTRDENPRLFWGIIAVQSAMMLVFYAWTVYLLVSE
jgi:hypothetical protein